jgi:hypothetical protein
MRGRTCLCLFALSFLIQPPGFLCGQSDRTDLRFSPDVTPFSRAVRALGRDPAWPIPRPPVAPPSTFGFRQLARAAGIIFSGSVRSIARHPASHDQGIEAVAITFHVERAIRGVVPGEDLTVSQWIGLWSSGQRYRIGERALFLFYPPSKVKLTSCVGGRMGRFAIDSDGWILLSAQQLSAFLTDPVLGGKSRVRFGDFVLAVRQASEEESLPSKRR